MNEQNNSTHTKVAVLIEKVDNLEENLMHKLRNNENHLKMIYEDITDIQNKLKYIAIGAITAFGLAQGGTIDILKGLLG